MKSYDLVFITNSPSFYKINLFNEIAKERKIFVFFLAKGNDDVVKEMNEKKYEFEYEYLSDTSLKDRNKVKIFFQLFKKIHKINFQKIIYSGWVDIECILLSCFTPKQKNCIQSESSIYESKTTGLKRFLKKIAISRISIALPSGIPHQQLFEALNYKGKSIITGGVGIFNKSKGRKNKERNAIIRYLYVGRLVDVKNLELLIDTFNQNSKPLTIVGNGVLEKELKNRANENISFSGFVENENIYSIYQSHDVFVLPSKSEPWGLVVDEAIYNGLPVIISDKVGCNMDMVEIPQTGIIFKYNEIPCLQSAIQTMEQNYSFYKENVNNFDFEKRDENQIKAYTQLV
jgi:glycosyltransferase involved in cell wall biosynthesis